MLSSLMLVELNTQAMNNDCIKLNVQAMNNDCIELKIYEKCKQWYLILQKLYNNCTLLFIL